MHPALTLEALPAGAALNALVAEKVFGKKQCDYSITGFISTLTVWNCLHESSENCYPKDFGPCLEKYSEDTSCAWKVVEKLRSRGLYLILNDTLTQYRARFFDASFDLKEWVKAPDPERTVWAPSAPVAICLAALKAISF